MSDRQVLRRRHQKSRLGCFRCKERRIKCGEEREVCKNCLVRGLPCFYPSKRERVAHAPINFVTSVAGPNLAQPSSAPAMFTARELTYFHHFLTLVSHPLPLGNDTIWLKEIPQLGHEHLFLMHSMLALGASEFCRTNPEVKTRYGFDILKHRGIAIAGMNRALGRTAAWECTGFADAVIASCYALMKQAAHEKDAIKDFEVFVKGAALMTERIRHQHLKTAMNLNQDWPLPRLEISMNQIAQHVTVDPSPFLRGLKALNDIEHDLSVTDGKPFLLTMRRTLNLFLTDPVQGYAHSFVGFGSWYQIAAGLLAVLREPNNPAGPVLVATFFADVILIKLLIPLQLWPDPQSSRLPINTLQQMNDWIDAMGTALPQSAVYHLRWANSITEMIPQPSANLRIPIPIDDVWKQAIHDGHATIGASSSLPFEEKLDVLRNMETKAHMLLGEVIRLSSELTSWFGEYLLTNYRQKITAPRHVAIRPKPHDTKLDISTLAQLPLLNSDARSTILSKLEAG